MTCSQPIRMQKFILYYYIIYIMYIISKINKTTLQHLVVIQYTSTVREKQDRNLPEIRENLFPAVKSEIQIRENLFSRNAQNRQSAKLDSSRNFMHTVSFAKIPKLEGTGFCCSNMAARKPSQRRLHFHICWLTSGTGIWRHLMASLYRSNFSSSISLLCFSTCNATV